MKITVLIPTYRRVPDLTRCLEALKAQERPADEVIVTVRDVDSETLQFLDGYDAGALPIRRILVEVPGVVAAMNAGLRAATGDVIALTDDDTSPYPDWLRRIEAHFASDPKVGGVGGRDWQPWERGDKDPVGIVEPWGRVVGNHHLGAGPARDVDFLKGANCAYRAEPLKAVAFDERLLGQGAQVHWEMGLGLKLRRAGWRLIYDPAVALDHHLAPRHDNDLIHRGIFDGEPHHNACHNGTLFLWEHFPAPQRSLFALWMLGIGTRAEPGLLHFLIQVARRDRLAVPRLRHTMSGRMAAIRTAGRTPRSERSQAPEPSAVGPLPQRAAVQTRDAAAATTNTERA
jgi:glycosyltransferase involved in cell wall biosynthesis